MSKHHYVPSEPELHRTTFDDSGAFGKEAVVTPTRLVLLSARRRTSISLSTLRSVEIQTGNHPVWAVALSLLSLATAGIVFRVAQGGARGLPGHSPAATLEPMLVATIVGGGLVVVVLVIGAWQCFRGYTRLTLDFSGDRRSLTVYKQDGSLHELASQLEAQICSPSTRNVA
jgi:hypothetical protein